MAATPVAAALAASVVALIIAIRAHRRMCADKDGGFIGSTNSEREKLLAILAELSRRFFHVCKDVAAIARTVRTKIEISKVAITEDKLREQLSHQCRVFEKLQEIQTEVSMQFQCTPEDIKVMQRRAHKDAEVQSYEDGFKTMLSDALGGMLPVLPNVKVPAGLTEEKVLEIQAEVHSLEAKKVFASMGGSTFSLEKLGEVLGTAQKDAWEQALTNHAQLVQGSPEVYHSAFAVYMRNDDFARESKKLDEAHQRRMVKLFQPNGRVPKA